MAEQVTSRLDELGRLLLVYLHRVEMGWSLRRFDQSHIDFIFGAVTLGHFRTQTYMHKLTDAFAGGGCCSSEGQPIALHCCVALMRATQSFPTAPLTRSHDWVTPQKRPLLTVEVQKLSAHNSHNESRLTKALFMTSQGVRVPPSSLLY